MPGDPTGRCRVDGVAFSCAQLGRMLAMDSAALAPVESFRALRFRDQEGRVRGVLGRYDPAYGAYLPVGVSGLHGGVVGDAVVYNFSFGDGAAALGFAAYNTQAGGGGVATPVTSQKHLLNPTPNVDDNRNRIAKMLENPKCRDFINNLLKGADAKAGDPVISTNPLDLFDEVKRQRGFVYGDTIRRVYGFDGSTVSGTISIGNAQVELARPILNVRTPQIVESQARIEAMSTLHELMHLAGKKGGYSDNVLAEVVSMMPGTLPPKGNISDLKNPRPASEYWTSYLEAACKLR